MVVNPVSPALGRKEEGDQEGSFHCVVSWRPAWATRAFVFKKKKMAVKCSVGKVVMLHACMETCVQLPAST